MINPTRIIVAGDSHGDERYIDSLIATCVANACDLLFVAGDFGFWPSLHDGECSFLDAVSEMASTDDIDVVWLDGNHENHEILTEQFIQPHFLMAALAGQVPAPFIEIRPRVYYAWRGSKWTWQGKKFMAVGGAYSIDKPQRVKYVSWWPDEEMRYAEARRVIDSVREHVDILLTHDMPKDANIGWAPGWEDQFPASKANRVVIRDIASRAKPRYLVHGHMHLRYTDNMALDNGGRCKVIGLGANINTFNDTHVLFDLGGAVATYYPSLGHGLHSGRHNILDGVSELQSALK